MQRPKRTRKLPLKLRPDVLRLQHLHDDKRHKYSNSSEADTRKPKSVKTGRDDNAKVSGSGSTSDNTSGSGAHSTKRGNRSRVPSTLVSAATKSLAKQDASSEIKQRPRRSVARPESYLDYAIDSDDDDDDDSDDEEDDDDDSNDQVDTNTKSDAAEDETLETTTTPRPRKRQKIHKERKPIKIRDSDEEDSGDEDASTKLIKVPLKKNRGKSAGGTDEKLKTFRNSVIKDKLSKLTKLRDLDKLPIEEKVAMANYLVKEQSKATAKRTATIKKALVPATIAFNNSSNSIVLRMPKEMLSHVLSFLEMYDHIQADLSCKAVLAVSNSLPHSWGCTIKLTFAPSYSSRNIPNIFTRINASVKTRICIYAPPMSFWKRILHGRIRELTIWYHPRFGRTYAQGAEIGHIIQLAANKCAPSLRVLRIGMSCKSRPVDQMQTIMSAIGKCLKIHTLYIPDILWNCKPEQWQELKPLVNLSEFDASHLKSKKSWVLDPENYGAQIIHGIVTVLGDKPLVSFSFDAWPVTIMDSPTTLLILTMLHGSFNSLVSLKLPNLVIITESMVEAICKFGKLQMLKLQFGTFNKNCLSALANSRLPIHTLKLCGTLMHASELSELYRLSSLTWLDLSNNNPTFIMQSIQHVAKITSLETLYINTNVQQAIAIDDFNPEILLGLVNLRKLHVSEWQMPRDTQHIFDSMLPRLKIIHTDAVEIDY